LLNNKEISNFFNEQDLLKIIDPSNYLGAAPTMAQRLLDNRKLP
jgi:adenylosuccinate lyase